MIDPGRMPSIHFDGPQATAGTAPQQTAQPPKKLWLWKNFVDGRPEYWAFDNPYPTFMDCGDPQTLGEPCGYAIFKESRDASCGRTEESVIAAIKRVWGKDFAPAAELVASHPAAADEGFYEREYYAITEAMGYPPEKDCLTTPAEYAADLRKQATAAAADGRDAARYRWLRDVVLRFDAKKQAVEVHEFIAPIAYGPNIDAGIDAAMLAAPVLPEQPRVTPEMWKAAQDSRAAEEVGARTAEIERKYGLPEQPEAAPASNLGNCKHCGGYGSVRVRGSVETCDECNGEGSAVAPSHAEPCDHIWTSCNSGVCVCIKCDTQWVPGRKPKT